MVIWSEFCLYESLYHISERGDWNKMHHIGIYSTILDYRVCGVCGILWM